MGTRKGTKFTEGHIAHILESRRNSKAWQEGRKSAAAKLKGRTPSLKAMAGSLATRSLRTLGLTREGSPVIWEAYVELHLARLRALRGRETVAA